DALSRDCRHGGRLCRRCVRQVARIGGGVDVRRRLLRRARPGARRVLHGTGRREGNAMRRALLALSTAALLLPANAFARGGVDPTKEFAQPRWVPIHIGPLNLSITKAVVYLMLGTVLTIIFGIVFMRGRLGQKPDRRETVGELIYEVAQVQIAEQGLPHKAIARWFPYVASLFLF